jgi:hypothetical protein
MQLTTRSVKAILAASSVGTLALSDPTFAAAQTFLGTPANNLLGGQVQVQITVDNGKITAISTPVTLSGRNSSYSSYAVPILTERALAAQSANIQGVSGASYVSAAWKTSLASAIANAGTAITMTVVAPTPTPTKSTLTIPVVPINPNTPTTPRYGEDDGQQFGHEGGEGRFGGGDDGNRFSGQPRPERSHRTPPSQTPLAPTPTKSATPATPSATPSIDLGLTMGAKGVIKKTITCVKGTVKKTVKAVNPKCPTGFTLKK